MKVKVWIISGIISLVAATCILVFITGGSTYKRGMWVTLAKTNAADGGFYFVRQMGDPFPFCEVGFGFISKSGTQYSYYLDHEGFPWRRVHLIEKDGNIYVIKNGLNVAVFNPEYGYFTNLLEKRIFDQQNGMSGGYGANFFNMVTDWNTNLPQNGVSPE